MYKLRFAKFVLLIPAIICALSLIGGPLNGIYVSEYKIPLWLLIFSFGIILQLFAIVIVSCPSCRKSPYNRQIGPFVLGTPIPEPKCSRCGFDFQRKDIPDQRPPVS